MSETGDEALVEAAGEPGKDTPQFLALSLHRFAYRSGRRRARLHGRSSRRSGSGQFHPVPKHSHNRATPASSVTPPLLTRKAQRVGRSDKCMEVRPQGDSVRAPRHDRVPGEADSQCGGERGIFSDLLLLPHKSHRAADLLDAWKCERGSTIFRYQGRPGAPHG